MSVLRELFRDWIEFGGRNEWKMIYLIWVIKSCALIFIASCR